MRILILHSIFFFLLVSDSFLPGSEGKAIAQETGKPWGLQQCIEYALKNNIQVKQNLLNQRISEATHIQARAQAFPSFSGSFSHSYNHGRRIDPTTNQFIPGDWSLFQNFAINTNLTLFGGFQNLNSIKQSAYDMQAAEQDVLKMQNDISLNIASAYLQILFAQELLDVALGQSEITKLQTDRTRKLVEVGNLPKGNLFDMEAQLAMEEVNVVNAENSLSLSSLNLIQMLNLDTVRNFTIAKPDIAMPAEILVSTTSGQIYDFALTHQPEIKSAEFKLKSSEKSIAIARAGILPRLTLSASYGTAFSSQNMYPTSFPNFEGYFPSGDVTSSGDTVLSPLFSSPTFKQTNFSDQVDQNLNSNIGFYLTVPIFNNLQASTSITRAKISRENAQLALQLQKDNLRKTIEQAFNDATSALKKYQASKKAVNAMEESFKYMDQKYSVGAVTTTDYNDAKNKLTKAKSDLLQTKYDYVFKLKVLDFYQGKPISL